MLAIEAPFAGGIGKVVPGGAPEMTGVLELVVSVALQPVIKITPQRRMLPQRRKGAKIFLSLAPLRLCGRTALDFFVILDRGSFILFLGERFTGNTILPFNPLAEIDKLAPFRTEGTKGIIFPLDWLTAGWAFHESLKPRNGPQRIKETRVA